MVGYWSHKCSTKVTKTYVSRNDPKRFGNGSYSFWESWDPVFIVKYVFYIKHDIFVPIIYYPWTHGPRPGPGGRSRALDYAPRKLPNLRFFFLNRSFVFLNGSFFFLDGSCFFLNGSFFFLNGSLFFLNGSFFFLDRSFFFLNRSLFFLNRSFSF